MPSPGPTPVKKAKSTSSSAAPAGPAAPPSPKPTWGSMRDDKGHIFSKHLIVASEDLPDPSSISQLANRGKHSLVVDASPNDTSFWVRTTAPDSAYKALCTVLTDTTFRVTMPPYTRISLNESAPRGKLYSLTYSADFAAATE